MGNLISERLKRPIATLLMFVILPAFEIGTPSTRALGASKPPIVANPATCSLRVLIDDLQLMKEHPEEIFIQRRPINHLTDLDHLAERSPCAYSCESCKTQIVIETPASGPYSLRHTFANIIPSIRGVLKNLPVKITLDSRCLCPQCGNGRPLVLCFTTICPECNAPFTWEVKDYSEAQNLKRFEISFPLHHLNESNLDEFDECERNHRKQKPQIPLVAYFQGAAFGPNEESIEISEYLLSKFICEKCQKKLQLDSTRKRLRSQ